MAISRRRKEFGVIIVIIVAGWSDDGEGKRRSGVFTADRHGNAFATGFGGWMLR